MLTVISPAKSLDFTTPAQTKKTSEPAFVTDAETLVSKLRRMSKKSIIELMGISDELAQLNRQRFSDWSPTPSDDVTKQAALAFNGEVYTGLEADKFKAGDFAFAQSHLRILSGLYGVLRPLDRIQPYRLEMGTRLPTRRGKTLYDFWGEKITESLNAAMDDGSVLINLASNEYFKSIKAARLNADVVTPIFKEIKSGKARTIASFAKRARGRMAGWFIRNRVDDVSDLPQFDLDGYRFDRSQSRPEAPVFTRPQPPPPR